MQTRRGIIVSGAGLALAGCAVSAPLAPSVGAAARIKAIEDRVGGRIGVYAIDTGSRRTIGHRQGERFAMASTFKLLLAAAILKLSQDCLSLNAPIYYTQSDLITYSPVTEPAIDAATGMGALTIEQLSAAIVTVSDNTAANLLFIPAFGPEGLTHFLRSHGDSVTRMDRREPELNENRQGDERDTTTPQAMARNVERFLTTDDVLDMDSREHLAGWLVDCSTGRDRLRAGFPQGWRVGDKTGTGGNGAFNDVAIAFPPSRKPIIIACYLSESAQTNDLKAAAQAEIARITVEEFA
jgi:beta-lactamase class A